MKIRSWFVASAAEDTQRFFQCCSVSFTGGSEQVLSLVASDQVAKRCPVRACCGAKSASILPQSPIKRAHLAE
ncbi:MAG: hypothetical protein ACI8W7_002068 [Gammaproteobacteria bacterium]|jgi:hypothetical protein